MRKVLYFILSVGITVLTLGTTVNRADAASSITAQSIIDLMNGLRTAHGLSALAVDPILMSTAQWTAEYMAENNLMDHIGDVRGRISAAGYGDGKIIFATENWAVGTESTTLTWLQNVWADPAHMLIVNGEHAAYYKNIGAGVAEYDGNIYFIMHAAYIEGGLANPTWDPSISRTPTTAQYMQPVITSTPNADGSITHVVQSGQALWSIAIAYNTHIEDIKALNRWTSDTVYVGQTLIIRAAPSATLTPTITTTPTLPTRTPTAIKSPGTAAPSKTPTRTLTPTPIIKAIPKLSRQNLGIIIIGVCGAGLAAVFLASVFRKKPKRKK